MTIKLSVGVRNAMINSYETAIGASPKLRIYSGAEPATLVAAPTGTLLAEIALPADWMADASNGTKVKSGTWQVDDAVGAGTAGYYRLVDTAGANTHEQGTVSQTGNGGDLELDNVNIAVNQQVIITAFSRTAPNA